jgi:hypothetical protein
MPNGSAYEASQLFHLRVNTYQQVTHAFGKDGEKTMHFELSSEGKLSLQLGQWARLSMNECLNLDIITDRGPVAVERT